MGLCNTHYRRKLKGIEKEEIRNHKMTGICKINLCFRDDLVAHNLCVLHYGRLKAHGDPNVTKNGWDGKYIDEDGYVWLGHKHPDNNLGKRRLEHHIVMINFLGRELFPKENVHHENGNRQDNRIENLELWSTSQPAGQRVEDKMKWVYEMLERYGEEYPPSLT